MYTCICPSIGKYYGFCLHEGDKGMFCWKQALLIYLLVQYPVIVVLQSLSHVWLSVTPGTAALQASLSFTTSQSLLKFVFIELVMLSSPLILCHLLLLLLSFFPSIFSNESAVLIRWPKYWSFNFNISPSNEYSGLNDFL